MSARILHGIVIATAAVLAAGCHSPAPSEKTVKVEVTDAGFVPAQVEARPGQPVVLLVTRKTEATCAREIVIQEANIRRELPLNQEVRIAFTPEKKGDLKYACGMDMITGTLKVQ